MQHKLDGKQLLESMANFWGGDSTNYHCYQVSLKKAFCWLKEE